MQGLSIVRTAPPDIEQIYHSAQCQVCLPSPVLFRCTFTSAHCQPAQEGHPNYVIGVGNSLQEKAETTGWWYNNI